MTPPVIQPQDDITIIIPLDSGGTVVTWPSITATDNSGTATLAGSTHTSGQFFPTGTTPVTHTFTDPSGNTASYTFNVNVVEGKQYNHIIIVVCIFRKAMNNIYNNTYLSLNFVVILFSSYSF